MIIAIGSDSRKEMTDSGVICDRIKCGINVVVRPVPVSRDHNALWFHRQAVFVIVAIVFPRGTHRSICLVELIETRWRPRAQGVLQLVPLLFAAVSVFKRDLPQGCQALVCDAGEFKFGNFAGEHLPLVVLV